MKKEVEEKENIEADDMIVVEDITTIEEGKHTGEIIDVKREFRKDLDYTDIHIIIDENKSPIKTGFPTKITR